MRSRPHIASPTSSRSQRETHDFVFLRHFLQLGGLQKEFVLVLGFLAEEEVSGSVLIEHANRVVDLNVEVIQHPGDFVAFVGHCLPVGRFQFVTAGRKSGGGRR